MNFTIECSDPIHFLPQRPPLLISTTGDLPRIGETVVYRDQRYRVYSVEHVFSELGPRKALVKATLEGEAR